MHAEPDDWAQLLDHLAAARPSEVEDLRQELGSRPALKAVTSPLERCGVVVSRSLAVSATAEGPHPHTTELARWDQVHPEPSDSGGLEDLTVAAVRAAVVAPEPTAGSAGAGAIARRSWTTSSPKDGCGGRSRTGSARVETASG